MIFNNLVHIILLGLAICILLSIDISQTPNFGTKSRSNSLQSACCHILFLWSSIGNRSNDAAPNYLLFAKGSPESILDRSTHALVEDRYVELTEIDRQTIRAQNARLATQGLRVLGFALIDGQKFFYRNRCSASETKLWYS